jgi:hypothetical protein
MMLTMRTSAERPDLWERGLPSAAVWPGSYWEPNVRMVHPDLKPKG